MVKSMMERLDEVMRAQPARTGSPEEGSPETPDSDMSGRDTSVDSDRQQLDSDGPPSWKDVFQVMLHNSRRYKKASDKLSSRGGTLVLLGLAMIVVGAVVVWNVVSDMEGISERQLRFLENLKFPVIYIVTVWFAPAVASLYAGLNALKNASVLAQASEDFSILAIHGVRTNNAFEALVESLARGGVLTEQECAEVRLAARPKPIDEME